MYWYLICMRVILYSSYVYGSNKHILKVGGVYMCTRGSRSMYFLPIFFQSHSFTEHVSQLGGLPYTTRLLPRLLNTTHKPTTWKTTETHHSNFFVAVHQSACLHTNCSKVIYLYAYMARFCTWNWAEDRKDSNSRFYIENRGLFSLNRKSLRGPFVRQKQF